MELLLGNVVNTNAAWIGQRLFEAGWRVSRQTVVPDSGVILDAMREAAGRSKLVIVSGGLGPTSDDVTRDALAGLFGVEQRESPEVVQSLREYFESRGRAMAPSNLQQALVPEGAEILHNALGTAPGLWMPARADAGLPEVILLPGPPRELYAMMEQYVLPRLRARTGEKCARMRNIKIVGIGESDLHELVDRDLAAIPGLEWGYCARPGEVDVRLIGTEFVLETASDILLEKAGEFVVSCDGNDLLEEVVVRELAKHNLMLATAESCTGGLIAKRVTDVAGASRVFHFGWVTYADEVKEKELGVPADMLAKYNAVSEPVARAMADGALRESGADIAVSVTGFAGPDGDDSGIPVGTVWLAWACRGRETVSETRVLKYPRDVFRQYVSQIALSGVLRLVRQ